MARDLDRTPGFDDTAGRIDQEGAALDPDVLAAIEFLRLDHAEGIAQRFVGVADELEPETLFRTEILMGLERVTRYAEYVRTELAELRQQRVEVDTLGGAARRAVLRVE